MKKRIYANMLLLSLMSVVISTLIISFMFYGLLETQIINGIKSTAESFADMLSITAAEDDASVLKRIDFSKGENEIRVTLISRDGAVLFDNCHDPKDMENHRARPEVEQAMKYGTGSARRFSNTMGQETYYYTVGLADTNIVRVSKTTNSAVGVFISIVPAIAGLLLLIFIASHLLSLRLTRKIVEPIDEIAASGETTKAYEELHPLIETVTELSQKASAEKIRHEFSANVSHELKTPLTTILGLSDMIAAGMAKEEYIKHFAGKIRDETTRLIALIGDIIRLSELDESEGQNEKNFQWFDPHSQALQVMEKFEETAAEKNLSLGIEGGGFEIFADRGMINELFYNLIDNGVKYNRPGGKLTVSLIKAGDIVKIIVEDTGIGVSSNHFDRIFERFYRVDESRSKKTGGTGLGLSIVKHIVKYHNGHVGIESEPGVGTRLIVELPAARLS